MKTTYFITKNPVTATYTITSSKNEVSFPYYSISALLTCVPSSRHIHKSKPAEDTVTESYIIHTLQKEVVYSSTAFPTFALIQTNYPELLL